MSVPVLLTEAEAAEHLRVCTRTLRKVRQSGQLPFIMIGSAIRYVPQDIEAFIAQCRETPRPPQKTERARSASRKKQRGNVNIIPFRDRQRGK